MDDSFNGKVSRLGGDDGGRVQTILRISRFPQACAYLRRVDADWPLGRLMRLIF